MFYRYVIDQISSKEEANFAQLAYLDSADIDECANNPCQNNGTCQDLLSNYTCICADGYSGPNCSTGRSLGNRLIQEKSTFHISVSITRY